MTVTVLVGNPRPESRTLRVASAVADAVCVATGRRRGQTIDLAVVATRLFDWPDDEVDQLTAVVSTSEVLVCASPTYKAAYTGLLKSFLDRYDTRALAAVTAVPVMTGGSPHHCMAPDVSLRPLLVELGASVPTSSLYVETARLAELDDVVEGWAQRNGSVLRRLKA